MGFDSSVVMEMLQQLELVGSEARPCAAHLTSALSIGGYREAALVSGTLHRGLEIIEGTMARLATHVVTADGLGEPGDCLGELVIRTRAMVIVDQLARVREALRDPSVRACSSGWFIGRFCDIDSVFALLQADLRQIHQGWRPYRPTLSEGVDKVDELSLYRYRITVRLAQQALEGIGDVPDFVHFLRCAGSVDNCVEISSAVQHIVAALTIRIDMGPNLARQPTCTTTDELQNGIAPSADRNKPLLDGMRRVGATLREFGVAIVRRIVRVCSLSTLGRTRTAATAAGRLSQADEAAGRESAETRRQAAAGHHSARNR
jgi:hypothetical protein